MRYWIDLKFDEFMGHKGVKLELTHRDDLEEQVYRDMIPDPLDPMDECLRECVKDSFSEKETETLREYFARREGIAFLARHARPVSDPNQVGISFNGWGGCDGYYHISEELENWPLPCRVHGYYDLEEADAGPCVNTDLTTFVLSKTNQGIVLKQPPSMNPGLSSLVAKILKDQQ
jgi:hypothetical protein